MRLGDLSAKYESNGDPGAISHAAGDYGGASYGAYQFANAAGVPAAFVSYLLNDQDGNRRMFGQQLSAAEPGSEEFDQVWSGIAQEYPDEFLAAQHDYVQQEYFDVAVRYLRDIGLDIVNRSQTLMQVVWSRAVQYGPGNMPELFMKALEMSGKNFAAITDAELINFVYEVNLTDKDWCQGSADIKKALKERFKAEREQALAMLKEEGLA